MKVSDRFFPRVWDGEKYFYPVFSELGVTYENESLPLTDENIKSLDWALGWHFHPDSKNTSLEFDHILEASTGLLDKNGKLIYEGDIISRNGMFRKVFWLDDEGGFGYEPGTLFEPLQTKTCEIVGNIHKNPELLESEEK